MRLYQVAYYDTDGRCRHKFSGTKARAKADQKELEAERGRSEVLDFEEVEVPTSKEEMIDWLNKWEG